MAGKTTELSKLFCIEKLCSYNVKDLNATSLYWSPLRLKAEEERIRKEEDKARKEFIKQEYLRRKQLKLMEDMDTVIKPRPTTGAKQRRGRPKSIHRDSMDSPKTPIRAATGNLGNSPLHRGQAHPSLQSVAFHRLPLSKGLCSISNIV